jgi:hypothetical protein
VRRAISKTANGVLVGRLRRILRTSTLEAVSPLRARVRNGRRLLDEPTDLPEGSEVELVPADGWDDLEDDDRKALHEALAASEEDVAQGRVSAAEELLEELRRAGR